MPMYDYRCPDCGALASEYRAVADYNKSKICTTEGCPCEMELDLATQARGTAVRGNYTKPIELQSMGFLSVPEDVAEHRKRFPEIDLIEREGSMIPVVRSLGQKRAYLKAAGWADVKSY